MQRDKIFRDPNLVGEAEYRAIHDCVLESLYGRAESAFEDAISLNELQRIISILENFREWANSLLAACEAKRSVVIVVRGGVAEVLRRPENVSVEIRDYDTDACDCAPGTLDDDGALVSRHGPEY